MKNKLREEIKILAKKITNEEKKFNTQTIKSLTKELYDKLIVLEYLELQIGGHSEAPEESLDSKSFREENWFSEPVPVPQPEHREDIVEPVMEKIKDIVAQMPEESDVMDEKLEQIFANTHPYMQNIAKEEQEVQQEFIQWGQPEELDEQELNVEEEVQEEQVEIIEEIEEQEENIEEEKIEEEEEEEVEEEKIEEEKIEEEKPIAIVHRRNELEEFASSYKQMPIFERKPLIAQPEAIKTEETNPVVEEKSPEFRKEQNTIPERRAKSLNDSVNKGLNIALNDRLIFIKHLFEGKSEDYTRVLSQINTMNSYEEASSFIRHQVKPDYNNWSNKEEYIERFMIIVEKRFG